MTNRTPLLAASILAFLSSLSLAACTSSDTGGNTAVATGGSTGVGGATGGGSSTAAPTGGVGTGGFTGGGSGTGGSPPATGGTVGAGGATVSAGGVTVSAGGATASVGGAATSAGGTTSGAGGATGDSTCVAGVATGNACNPAIDTAVCVRSTRNCTCEASGSWNCVSIDGTGGAPGGSGGATTGEGGATTSAGGTTSGSGGATTSEGGAATNAGGAPASGGAASTECVLPELPDLDSLPRNEKLPSPFTFFNGDPVTTKAQWECRRREIQAMAAKYVYGPYPFEPDETTGTVSGGDVSITCKEGSKTETFSATISGSGDVITLDMASGILPSSSKSLSFGSGFETKIKNLFGLSEMNTNVATGWMVDRVIDVLEQNPDGGHDPTKMAVSGCSGCGKGAFLVGVFSRIPMVVIVESGGGGAANFRQAEWFRHGDGNSTWQCDALPQSIDNLEDNGICGPWVTSAAAELRSNPDKVNNLPFDQHLLLATIAPRYLVHFSNNNGPNSWCHLGGTCEALSAWAAQPVWNALGVPDNMAFEMYNGGHCGVGDTGIAAAMFKRAFEGDTSTATGAMKIPDSGVQQPVSEWKDMWIDWDMETVLQ